MKLIGAISTAVLSLSLGVGIPAYAQQEQHDQQEENKDKPAREKIRRRNRTREAGRDEQAGGQREAAGECTASEQQQSREDCATTEEQQGREKCAGATRPGDEVGQPARSRSWQRWRTYSRRSLQGQFRTGTQVSRQRSELPRSSLPIRRLLIRIRGRLAEQLALHARRVCRRN